MTTENIDWKPIALELAQRVNFAISHLTCQGAGLLLNMEKGTTQHWRDHMADGLEKVPGVTVNRELMHTLDLPKNQRKKAQAEIVKRQTEASNA